MELNVDVLNYVAINFLEEMGNDAPTQQEIDWMEQSLAKFLRYKGLAKDKTSSTGIVQDVSLVAMSQPH